MRRGMKVFMEWVDELAEAYIAREAMLAGVAARGLTPPKADDTPLTIRWVCAKPTETPNALEKELLSWPRESLAHWGGDSLLDRYRFPFL